MATQPKAPTGEVGVTAEIAGAPYGVLGDNRTWQGFVHQAEHVPELLWPESIRWYERMLYTDTRIEAGFLSLTQPLWDYVWALEPRPRTPTTTLRFRPAASASTSWRT
jgi:hypothetical protein